MRSLIRKNGVQFDEHVSSLFHGPLDECYRLEANLRPHQRMGWNVASGGCGYNYKSNIENLSLFRSEMQKERMANNELRVLQGETFKQKYYQDSEMQELRKKRTREHMATPGRREACLSAMHRKVKCLHCNFESNSGNVKQHMKRKHS